MPKWRACGCENVVECAAQDTADVLKAALDAGRMTVIVSKCRSGNVPVSVIELDPGVIRHRFMEEIARRNR